MSSEGYLCVSFRFLLARYHGRIERDRAAEWPPSPLRVFQAFVAAGHRGRGEQPLSDEEELALRWIEDKCEREPPLIVAPERESAAAFVMSVPNNDLDAWAKALAHGREPEKSVADLRTLKVVRPTRLVEDDQQEPVVHLLWRISDEERKNCEAIDRLARRIIALGWGTDLVAAHATVVDAVEASHLSGVKWRGVSTSAKMSSRRPVPIRGTLDALRVRHSKFLSRVDSGAKRYLHVQPYVELDEGDAPRRMFAYVPERAVPRPYCVFEFQEGVAFRPVLANEVAAMVRSLACERSKKDKYEFPGGSERFVAGHVNGAKVTPPRFSYLPLPTIGHRYADGMIRRVLIAEPFGGDGLYASWAESRLRNGLLKDIHGTEKAVLLEPRSSSLGVIDRYVRESRIWTSVTPIVLPGFDDCEYEKAVRLCFDTLSQAGIPVEGVEELSLRKAPYWPGGLHPAHYRRPNYLRHLPAWHLKLVFREPVTGPLSIGAGRHCGLGVMAATVES